MKIEKLRMKEHISIQDKIMAIEDIVMSHFSFDVDGYVTDYTPYFAEIATVEAIMNHFTEGVEFEENEIIYNEVVNNKELANYVDQFFVKKQIRSNTTLTDAQMIMKFVMENAADKINFLKQMYLNQLLTKKDSLSSLINTLTEKIKELHIPNIENMDVTAVNQFIKKFNESDFSAESIVKAFLNSDYKKQQDDELNKVL